MAHRLNLDHLIDTTDVTYGSVTATMRRAEQLPPIESRKAVSLGRRLDELMAKPELSADETAEIDALPGKLCALVLVGGAETAAKFDPIGQWAIVRSFSDPRAQKPTSQDAASVEQTTGA